jgi:hypothetical protein
VRVREPDTLIRKLSPVDALCLCPVVIDHDLTALHHKAWDNPLEHPVLVVQIHAKFPCAKGTEVLHSPRELREKLHHNAAFLVPFLAFCSNLDVLEHLRMAHVEVWNSVVRRRVLITVDIAFEDLGSGLALALVRRLRGRIDLGFDGLIMLTNRCILLLELESLSAVSERLCIVQKMHVGQTAQVESFC